MSRGLYASSTFTPWLWSSAIKAFTPATPPGIVRTMSYWFRSSIPNCGKVDHSRIASTPPYLCRQVARASQTVTRNEPRQREREKGRGGERRGGGARERDRGGERASPREKYIDEEAR